MMENETLTETKQMIADLFEEITASDKYIRLLRDEINNLEVELGVNLMERKMLVEQLSKLGVEIDWG